MKVSIILPTNRQGGLDLVFRALQDQSMWPSEYELIVVDDYGDREDETVKMAERYGVENLKYLKSKGAYWRTNRPIANARNTGLIHAQGEIVVFVDDYIWFPTHFLRRHWKTYKEGYCMIGSSRPVEYSPNRLDEVEHLPNVDMGKDEYLEKLEKEGRPVTQEQLIRSQQLEEYGSHDTRGEESVKDCPPGHFYCMNTSAPLDKIIEVNGFNEIFDLCSEEDIDMGLRLGRAGCKFWYRTCYHCTIVHMEHGSVETPPPKYKKVTYEDLRERKTLQSQPDEVQLVMKEKYGTDHDGSWGLHEYYQGQKVANIVDGEKIFDLKKEREYRI